MLGINESRLPSPFLSFGNYMQSESGFAGGFRPENFNDPTPRKPADAQAQIKSNRASRDNVGFNRCFLLAEFHHCPFAELLFYLR